MKVFLANFRWFLSTVPNAVAFAVALRFPRFAQRRVARRIDAETGGEILREMPTSGSTGATKWVPYTAAFLREFARAIDPWVFSLYVRHPSLFFSTHYWSISPFTETGGGGKRKISDDSDYLSRAQRKSAAQLFTVSRILAGVSNPEEHMRLTVEGLVGDRRIGLMSVWHPSSLLLILERVRVRTERSYAALWPHLRVISCWDRAFAAADAERLRMLFPDVVVEGKGLLATEGVVTIPWFGRRVAAVRSHVLTLQEVSEDDVPSADKIPLVEAVPGRHYLVFITAGNGEREYPLGDVVECTGRIGSTPMLEFLHRSGGVSDLHGEKLHPGPVGEALRTLGMTCGGFSCAYLMPRVDRCGYILKITPVAGGRVPTSEEVETVLCENYYYRHTRNLGQLDPVRVEVSPDALAEYCHERGVSPAAAKPPSIVLR